LPEMMSVWKLIIVNDASSDNSLTIARDLEQRHENIKVFTHEKNQGKGAALRTGFKEATGDYVAVQDADLEYDPRELLKLIEPLREGDADVVLGSRFASSGPHRVLYFWHSMGNKFLTFLSNMFTDLNLTDMETCYKVFKREVIQSIEIEENRFGFEPEIVAKVAQRRLRVFEMGISYKGPHLRRGQKNRSQRWLQGVVLHIQVQSAQSTTSSSIPHLFIYWWFQCFDQFSQFSGALPENYGCHRSSNYVVYWCSDSQLCSLHMAIVQAQSQMEQMARNNSLRPGCDDSFTH
jgi:glycosyltransferase involved in cell wall biosynthesis